MVCHHLGCLGNYNFDHIAYYARKRFVEGINTITLMEQANTEREKEEIALVCLLDVEDDKIKELEMSCKYSTTCQVINCREKLRKMIGTELTIRNYSSE